MPDILTPLDLGTLPRYTSLIAVGLFISLVGMVYRLRGEIRAAQVVDVCLGGMVGGVLLARAFHVGLHWRYFQDHTTEITQLRAGGLDWHGAVIGALIGIVLMAWIRKVQIRTLMPALALVLPLMALMAWWGCYAAQCSYGAEVENLSFYPAWQVWEAPDIFNIYAPRYRTQQIGMGMSIGLLLLAALLVLRIRSKRVKQAAFPLILALLSAGMLVIGEWRGDFAETLGGLRGDQWLDALLLLSAAPLALVLLLRGKTSENRLYGQHSCGSKR